MVKIRSVTAEILLILTNVARTNVAWTNVHLTIFGSKKFGPNCVSNCTDIAVMDECH